MKRTVSTSEPTRLRKKAKGADVGRRSSSRGSRLAAVANASAKPDNPSKSAQATKTRSSAALAQRNTVRRATDSNKSTTPSAVSGRQQRSDVCRPTRVSPRRSSTRALVNGSAAGAAASSPVAVPASRTLLSTSPKTAGTAVGSKYHEGAGATQRGMDVRSTAVGQDAELLATLLSPVLESSNQPQAKETPASFGSEQTNVDPHLSSSSPLEEMFEALEQILSMFRRRRQATLFKQVKGAVEGMCHRSFTKQHLGQIVSVYPDAYTLSSKRKSRPTRGGYILRDLLIEVRPTKETKRKPLASTPASKSEQRDGKVTSNAGGGAKTLTVTMATPTEDMHRSGRVHDGGNITTASRGGDGSPPDSRGKRPRAEKFGVVSEPARRRDLFRELLCTARARHCKCGGGSSVGGPHQGASARECSCLPEAPLPDTSPLPVAGSVDGKGAGCGGNGAVADGRVVSVQALLGSATNSESFDENDVVGRDALKDVDILRQRLREKDRKSAMEKNKSGEEKEADRRRRGNLPALADAVRSFFAHARRNTCSLDAVVDALSSSGRLALSGKEAKERLRTLAGVVPEWCAIIAPPSRTTVAINDVNRSGVAVDEEASPWRSAGDGVQTPRAKEVVRVNQRISYQEVRQMVVFMAGGGDSRVKEHRLKSWCLLGG